MKLLNCSAFAKSAHLLSCPVCAGMMFLEGAQLKCINNHNFDLAKKGYANFLNKPGSDKYDKTLFDARKKITQNGFFDPLINGLVTQINLFFPFKKHLTIVDAGCGEGSLFSRVVQFLQFSGFLVTAIGLDIAKDGIARAAAVNQEISWIVADLVHLPIVLGGADIVLNTLSPANYSQFKQLLKKGGYLLKTVPGKKYLIEIRQNLNNGEFGNAQVIRLFEANFRSIEKKRIVKAAVLTSNLITDLVHHDAFKLESSGIW
jgi:23S rRNA (guanine745-N1)-methyltransferase